MTETHLCLDDLYKMVAHIYSDKNAARTATSTFTHFVEVCGMLTILDRKKVREGVDVTDALCKALGWYFPLLAKMRVRSVENLIFRKFPKVCPYCRRAPHDDAICKLVRGTERTVNHEEVIKFYNQNWNSRPSNLDQWQLMFQSIYPRSVEQRGRSAVGLFEELGELAEAVRVFEKHPQYFLGEAADTFSYLMGYANEYSLQLAQEGKEFSFEKEFLKLYPGLCIQCGTKICSCPSIPAATVGRMAKELSIRQDETPFIPDIEFFFREGQNVAHTVLNSFGGHAGLAARLPFERGETNKALVALCLRIADAIDGDNHSLAEMLRSEGLKLNVSSQEPGTPRSPIDVGDLLERIQSVFRGLNEEFKAEIRNEGGLIGELGTMLDKYRVLYVHSLPVSQQVIRVTGELRAIRECMAKGVNNVGFDVDDLPAATPVDLRRKLLDHQYDIIHFSGHGDGENLIFESEDGNSIPVPISSLKDLIARSNARCVIMNACWSGISAQSAIAPITIGMTDVIDDSVAVEFSRGFYDAITRGREIGSAFEEGITAVKMMGQDHSNIKLFIKES